MELDCIVCGHLYEGREGSKTCSNKCRQLMYRNAKASKDYTANKIIVKEYTEEGWLIAASLAAQYVKPMDWINRSLEACRIANVHHDYFIQRYLEEDKTIPMNEHVNLISKRLQKEECSGI